MQSHLLSYLILTPIVAALIALILPSSNEKSFKWLALTASIVQAGLLGLILNQYNVGQSGAQLVEKYTWFSLNLSQWGLIRAEYFLAVDGLSLPLVALSVFVMLIAVISSWKIKKNIKGYFILILILNASIIGSFTALDFLLFYLFFEFMLLPMFFLIGIWGGPGKEYASIKFFLYTLLGSILILIVIIALYISAKAPGSGSQVVHTFNITELADPSNYIPGSFLHSQSIHSVGTWSLRSIAFIFLLIGFGIKLPMVPFHTWLPDAHVEAPTPVSVILAALLLKVGGYGILRIVYPIFPAEAVNFSWLVATLGVVSILYGALNAMASKDLKRLIAYSSVSHMGFVLLGVSSVTHEGVAGSVYQMVSHGIITSMLFILAGVLSDRTQDRLINNYSGLAVKMPVYFSLTLIGFFASLGLPGFSGFIAEILVLLGAFASNQVNGLVHESFAVIATLGLILGAGYYLWTIQRMFFGAFSIKNGLSPDLLTDLTKPELLLLVPLAFAALLFGIMPQPLMELINPFAEQFINTVSRK
ncbi:MAG: NADH-quinone oxidoreductase subunit M [Flammeovirgaceae bacterium]|nr:NADH-quinone oxidoreductase subunit M [Flammeovirgaceae bacterium]